MIIRVSLHPNASSNETVIGGSINVTAATGVVTTDNAITLFLSKYSTGNTRVGITNMQAKDATNRKLYITIISQNHHNNIILYYFTRIRS